MELEKNKKVLTLKEKQDRAVARLEGLKKQIKEASKRTFILVFSGLMIDEEIYVILKKRLKDKEFKNKVRREIKELIILLDEEKGDKTNGSGEQL